MNPRDYWKNNERKTKQIFILILIVFALIGLFLRQIATAPSNNSNLISSPSPSMSASVMPTAVPTPLSKETSSRSTPPAIKKTAQPKVSPTPSKSSAKLVVPEKYVDTIPINELYPFPIVGKQIEAGYYYDNHGACDVVVYDAKGREIFSEQSESGMQILINLQSGDQVQNYCPLIKGLPPIFTGGNIPSGMHIINGDLKPGIYTTSNNCFYWVTKGNAAQEYTRGVTDNNEKRYPSTAGVAFTLSDVNEAVFFHSGCGKINKVG